ncbi:MAG: regulatory protein RecX [Chloroflexi bacterium]|nr:regulatory protein RecX [Chloroflexota bacterium]
MDSQQDADQLQKAITAALRLVAQRSRTQAELRQRLGRRFPAGPVEAALARLRELGYVDDASFASQWVQGRDQGHPRAAALVRRELLARGVGPQEAEAAVAALDDVESAYQVARKAAPSLRGLGKVLFQRRLWGRLRRRGFGPELAWQVIERLWREGEASSG